MRPKITEFNLDTNESIVREMNDKEFTDYELAEAADKAEKNKIKNKDIVKQSAQAKLAALGLTEDEVTAIIGA